MPAQPTYSIIIPVFNESKSIGNVLDLIKGSNLESYEIIVVDGGSVDGTLEIINSKKDENIILIKNIKGYINSLIEGSKIAKGEIIIWIDGDGTYNPNEINNLINPIINSNLDVVIGSRFIGTIMPGSLSIFKKIGNSIINRVFNILFNSKITDLTSGFRAMKKDILIDRIVINKKLKIKSHEDLVYYTAIFKKMNFKINEVPITFFPRYGKPKLSPLTYGYKIIINMFKIWSSNINIHLRRN